MQERILTPEQVAQILQVHPFTVLKFIKQGKLQASKLGRVYRIRESDLENFLDNTSGRSGRSGANEASELPTSLKKIKNKNKTSPNSDSSNSSELNQQTATSNITPQNIIVTEARVDQVETSGEKPKHGGEDHYYILQ